MSDLSRTSFYGGGQQEGLKGPPGDTGPQGPQGPAGPMIPLPAHPNNATALAAGLPIGTLYIQPSGAVYGVI